LARLRTSFVILALFGCHEELVEEPPPPPPPVACASGERTLEDGSCLAPGIPSDTCPQGFVSDDAGGCAAVLPAEPCPSGFIAVPGDASCREIAPCGQGQWGEIPVDATTIYVDGAFGGTGNGSATSPYTTIAEAVAGAASGTLIAIAAGTYQENLPLYTGVKLWGRCPSMVEIHGDGMAAPTIIIVGGGASGAEIRDLAVTGTVDGIGVSGATGVIIDRVWIHDTARRGLVAVNESGVSEVTLRGSLIEHTHVNGVRVEAAAMTIEASAVRDTTAGLGGMDGTAVWIQDDPNDAQRSNVTVRGALLERSVDLGMFLGGSDVLVEATAIRDVAPRPGDMLSGRGIEIIDDNGTQNRTDATLRGVTVERTVSQGVFVAGSDAVLEAVVVRDTAPRASDMQLGRGVAVEPNPQSAAATKLELRQAVLERNHEHGLYVSFGEGIAELVWVRDTFPRPFDQKFGRGVEVRHSPEGPAHLTVRDSWVERSVDTGILMSAETALENVRVSGTTARATDGLFGDGIDAVDFNLFLPSAPIPFITLDRVHALENARAGLGNFGCLMELRKSRFECNPIALSADALSGGIGLIDGGENSCGCGQDMGACQTLGALQPPEPL
jgi:hypothetical protein